jgi:tRNA A37 threonylcarbamoyladenosine modification protein TsaB
LNQPGNSRLCLAIEASNPGVNAEVALGMVGPAGEPATILAIEALREVGRNEDDLLPAIDRVCRAGSVTPRQLRMVAVSIGPGGYTSLRVACAAAKMICETTGAACIPVPSALALVTAARELATDKRVGVLLAGKDQSAHLTPFSKGGWQPGAAVPSGSLIAAPEFPVDEIDAVIGDRHIPPPIRQLLATRAVPIIEPRFCARACLELAAHLPAIDPIQLVPFYPREPDAVTLWRLRARPDQNQ